ncbi:Short chain dehydrogenase [Apiospora marii]|uniref:Short chain dehydrogenase n=1 Tax=Apiospora marii TaxID=335849 RepID=A0ABR1R000_9PEZI
MAPNFDVTPQKEGSVPSYLYRQLFFTPQQVAGVSLEGKTAIVTGSNCGVGLECSRQLLDLGISRLILAVRSRERGQAAAADLSRERNPAGRSIEVWELDHLSYDSVRAFADRTRSLERIDLVILNAGSLPAKQTLNPQTGHDECVQVNYLSMCLLLVLLLDVIRTKPNIPCQASVVAKLATVVSPSMAVINLATPGMVHDSNMNRETKAQLASKIVEPIRRKLGYTSVMAARLILDAAVNHGPESHGQYLSEQKIKPMAPIVYTTEGEALRDQIWEETLAEFSFTDIRNIIDRFKGIDEA